MRNIHHLHKRRMSVSNRIVNKLVSLEPFVLQLGQAVLFNLLGLSSRMLLRIRQPKAIAHEAACKLEMELHII